MTSPAAVIAEHFLDEQSYAENDGASLSLDFIAQKYRIHRLVLQTDAAFMVAKETAGDGLAVTFYDTGGRDPGFTFSGSMQCAVLHPSIQVRVRAASYPTAYATAKEVQKFMLTLADQEATDGSLTVKTAYQTGGINSIGQDANNNTILTLNYNLDATQGT